MIYFYAIFASVLLVPNFGHASGIQPCLTKHVYEAMALNEQRKPLYERASQGRSTKISNKMIWLEYRLLLASPLADGWAAFYQASGIPVLCQDLISMSKTPPFTATNPDGKDSLSNFRQPDIEYLKKQMFHLLKEKSWIQLAEFTDKKIQDLDSEPRYNCMVKHILESIRRMAALTPVHAGKASAQGMSSTVFLSKTLLWSHILLLDESAELDRLAAPLQAEGVPIICQDVPVIPWP